MKRRILMLIAVAAFATALSTNAFGQTGNTVKADITFDFRIGERIYPAGEYRIGSISSLSGSLLQISSVRDVNKTQFLIANHSDAGKRQTPKLVFQKYGGNYFLTKIVLDSGGWGYSSRPSRRQREGEKNLALASLETIEVSLAR